MTKVRIFLVDDHPELRQGLRELLDAEPDLTVVGEAADGATAVTEALALAPDVVVMDLSMPRLGGAEATEQIKRAAPRIHVLALTAHVDQSYVQRLLRAGASGYVLKLAASEELVRAIRTVVSGEIYIDPTIARRAVGSASPSISTRRNESASVGRALSELEMQVLRLLSEGFAIREIATKLEVTAHAAEASKARAMETLKLRGHGEIVRYALERGWLKNG